MTTYSGKFSLTSNDLSLGDLDESSFQTSANGSLNLALTFDPSGNATGTIAGSGSVSGTSSGETDGDDDSFSDDLAGTSTATGTRQRGVNVYYTSNAGDFVQFSGTFNSSASAVTGTVTISDPNLSNDVTIPNVTLKGTQYTLALTFSQPTISSGTLTAAIYQPGNPNPIYTESQKASCDPAFPLLSKSAAITANPNSSLPGLVFAINNFAGGINQSAVELHVGTVGPPAVPQYSWDSQSCLVVSKINFLDPLENEIAVLAGSAVPDPYTDAQVANYLNANVAMTLTTSVGLQQPTLSTVINPDGSFQFDTSTSIEKEIKVVYSVEDITNGSPEVLTTREALISANTGSTAPITAAMLQSGTGSAPDSYVSVPASRGLIGADAETYQSTFGDPVTFSSGDKYIVGIDGYQVQYQNGTPTNPNNSPWYFDSSAGEGNTDLTNESLMFPTNSADFEKQLPVATTGTSNEINVLDTLTNQAVAVTPTPYSGPVAGLQHQYVYTGTDNVNIAVTDDNWFLKGGPGEDALQAFGGYNVLDGSTGSNFLTGGSGGTNTFFVDDRSPPSDIWSTVNDFHVGDDATVFGIVNSPAIQWFDNQGAVGYTGLTLHVFGQNAPTASLTLVGYSSSDLGNGRLSVQFGNEADGTPFMHIIGTG